MKILIASDLYPPFASGVSTVAENLGSGLAKSGHKVTILTIGESLKETVEEKENLKIIRLPSLGIPFREGIRFFPPLILKVRKIMKKESPEVVNIQSLFGVGIAAFIAAKEEKIPIVGTNNILPENVSGFLRNIDFFEDLVDKGLWAFNRFFYQRCNFLTTPTQTGLAVLKKHIKGERMEAISSGIDLSKFGKRLYTYEKAKERLGLKNLPVILFVGRLAAEKRVDFLLRSFQQVRERLESILVVVGTGPEETILRNLVKGLSLEKDVVFAGYVTEEKLKEYYEAANVFALPSKAELQGIVCLEAATYGVPLVGANSVALPELVRNNETGFLFDPESEADLTEKLLMVLSDKDLQEKLGQGAIRIARAHDLSVTIKKYERVFQKCVEESKYQPTNL
ncbi:MAG: glycosyltransferase [Patescibacteria group bacterium]|nr:glycosyltransferase [Patescibacteria group bacterium]